MSVITRLGDFIGLPVGPDEARAIGDRMFGKGRTFRKGRIGSWKDTFDDETTALFEREVGDRLSRFGYR